jgi:hypothetical protein
MATFDILRRARAQGSTYNDTTISTATSFVNHNYSPIVDMYIKNAITYNGKKSGRVHPGPIVWC